MAELSRIAVVNMKVDWWTAGTSFTRMLVESLAAAKEGARGPELMLLSRKKSGVKEESLPATVRHFKTPHYAPGERLLRAMRGMGEKSELYETALRYRASVVLPVLQIDLPRAPVPTIGWIPDFQHRHWPDYYSKSSLASRDRAYRELAERARLILLSSESARNDLAAFLPEHTAKARVLPFPSLFAFHPPEAEDPHATVAKYHLPEKFALVAGQFWQHKNQRLVVEAVALLGKRGVRVPVVMIGQPSDFRDPQNRTVSDLLQRIAEADLAGTVTVLGQVAYGELIALMRAAAVIVQPSQSEGWSTVVQDGKALGRPLICSAIPTHREQAPEALGFFEWNRPGGAGRPARTPLARPRSRPGHGARGRMPGAGSRVRAAARPQAPPDLRRGRAPGMNWLRDQRKARPLFSIVIPAFNAAEKLERSIQSVFREPAEWRELWVMDGGSRDGTLEVLRKHESRLRWSSAPDAGVYDAMNKGIARSGAPFLYFLGAGDTLRPGVLEKVARHVPRSRAAFIYGNVFMQDRQLIWDGEWTPEKFRTRTPCQQAIFYDRRIFDWHGGFDLRFKTMADYAMNIRCFGDKRIRKIFVDEVIADYEGAGFSATCRDEAFYEARPALLQAHLGVPPKK